MTDGEKKMPNKYKIHNRIICDVSLYDCNRMFVVLQLTVEKNKIPNYRTKRSKHNYARQRTA